MSVPTPIASAQTSSVVAYIERRIQRFLPHAVGFVEGACGGYIIGTAYLAATCHFPVVCPADACNRFAGMCDTLRGQVTYSIPYLMEMFASGQNGACSVDLVGREAAVTYCRDGLSMPWLNVSLAAGTLVALHMNKARIQTWLTKWYVDHYNKYEVGTCGKGKALNGMLNIQPWTNELINDRALFKKPLVPATFVPSAADPIPPPKDLFKRSVNPDWPGTGALVKDGTALAKTLVRQNHPTGPASPTLAAPNTPPATTGTAGTTVGGTLTVNGGMVVNGKVVQTAPQEATFSLNNGEFQFTSAAAAVADTDKKAEDYELILDAE